MNLPNKITMFRVCMIPIFLYFYLAGPFGTPGNQIAALAVFALASVSDALDGHIARSRGLITNFGKLMDPLADKMLVSAALVAMIETAVLPAWVTIVLVSREFFISAYRQLALERNIVLAASNMAKYKTAAQMVMIPFLLLPFGAEIWQSAYLQALKWMLIILCIVLSLLSAAEYVYKNKGLGQP
jgi:CDP-diacylglycerol--glycerol-3-phosphate 3-phosphatidyltransferase